MGFYGGLPKRVKVFNMDELDRKAFRRMDNQMIWINGKFSDDPLQISVFDKVILGMSVFTSILVDHGRPIWLRDHLRRLNAHARVMRLKLGFTLEELEEICTELIHRSPEISCGFGALRLELTAGVGARGLDYPPEGTLFMTYSTAADPRAAMEVKILCHPRYRRNADDPLSRIKSGSYGLAALAKQEARLDGFDDVMFLNHHHHVTCASSANILVMADGRYYTPSLKDGVMDGMMRAHVMRELKAEERTLTLQEVKSCDHVWLINSFGIRAVKQIDDVEMLPKSLSKFIGVL